MEQINKTRKKNASLLARCIGRMSIIDILTYGEIEYKRGPRYQILWPKIVHELRGRLK